MQGEWRTQEERERLLKGDWYQPGPESCGRLLLRAWVAVALIARWSAPPGQVPCHCKGCWKVSWTRLTVKFRSLGRISNKWVKGDSGPGGTGNKEAGWVWWAWRSFLMFVPTRQLRVSARMVRWPPSHSAWPRGWTTGTSPMKTRPGTCSARICSGCPTPTGYFLLFYPVLFLHRTHHTFDSIFNWSVYCSFVPPGCKSTEGGDWVCAISPGPTECPAHSKYSLRGSLNGSGSVSWMVGLGLTEEKGTWPSGQFGPWVGKGWDSDAYLWILTKRWEVKRSQGTWCGNELSPVTWTWWSRLQTWTSVGMVWTPPCCSPFLSIQVPICTGEVIMPAW